MPNIAYVQFASGGKEYAYFTGRLVPQPGRPVVIQAPSPGNNDGLKIVLCTRVENESPPNPLASKEIYATLFTQEDAGEAL